MEGAGGHHRGHANLKTRSSDGGHHERAGYVYREMSVSRNHLTTTLVSRRAVPQHNFYLYGLSLCVVVCVRTPNRYVETWVTRESGDGRRACAALLSRCCARGAAGRTREDARTARGDPAPRGIVAWGFGRLIEFGESTIFGNLIYRFTTWRPPAGPGAAPRGRTSLYINNRQPYGSLSNVLRKPAGEDLT